MKRGLKVSFCVVIYLFLKFFLDEKRIESLLKYHTTSVHIYHPLDEKRIERRCSFLGNFRVHSALLDEKRIESLHVCSHIFYKCPSLDEKRIERSAHVLCV